MKGEARRVHSLPVRRKEPPGDGYPDQARLQGKGLSSNDVLQAIQSQNLIEPGGTAKVGQFEYDVDINSDAQVVADLNDLPVRTINGTTVYVRDVATVSDGFAPQINVVRQDGKRGVLLTCSRLAMRRRSMWSRRPVSCCPEWNRRCLQLIIKPLSDQSIFVRGAVNGAIIAAALTGLMILVFLGSWRSTIIIAISIPLSILSSVIALGLLLRRSTS